ncbi:hypothetical protein FN846DRAFT_891439 [Sphaerosporella brunnea]|uniref:Uncharacterized protein n=1 Tax=Sphaerosporella brunnea TaxID=1250544 RepID=A0A5J5ETI4_9PEZI|nr:hypothetical protein FN846DRAFT_891439 [Sphaerosporella brunnea]
MSADQQRAQSALAQAEEDAMRVFYKEISGRWGMASTLTLQSSFRRTVPDTLYTAAGMWTVSAQKTSWYTAFLYVRKIILREQVPAGRKEKHGDADSGSEANTESDGKEHPSPASQPYRTDLPGLITY